MVTVTLFQRNGEFTKFLSMGHANFASHGEDIVCAGISALTQTCANALESVAHVAPKVKVGEGILSVKLPDDCHNHDAQVLFKALHQGLKDIQQSYPKHIRIIIKSE